MPFSGNFGPGALVVLVACSDSPAGPGPNGQLPLSPVVVSAPDRAGGVPGVLPTAGAGVAYVSLPPGSYPAGVSVTVQDGRGGYLVNAAVAGGLTFATLSAAGTQTCGVTATGAGYCWGTGYLGAGME